MNSELPLFSSAQKEKATEKDANNNGIDRLSLEILNLKYKKLYCITIIPLASSCFLQMSWQESEI